MSDIDISVIVCTYNRPQLLARIIKSLLKQGYSADKYEIIVVDNCPQHASDFVVKTFLSQTRVKIYYLMEKKPGLSVARNTGIKIAKGDIIAFIDDDALADPHWLSAIVSSFTNNQPICVGGKILPLWPPDVKKPAWLTPYLKGYLSILDYGDKTKEIKEFPYFFGTNISFRKKAFKKYGYFRTYLGRKGNSLVAGEDTDFCARLVENGEKLLYNPEAVVHHLIVPERLKKDYFRKAVYNSGRSQSLRHYEKLSRLKIFLIIAGALPLTIFRLIAALIFLLKGDREKRVNFYYYSLYLMGYTFGIFENIFKKKTKN
jgi:glycosyltransferase involved in cell wall biosynthesis